MTRKKFSERQVIEVLAHQGCFVRCYRCKEPFLTYVVVTDTMYWLRQPEREHLTELAIGGLDLPCNCAYSCSECHAKITNGSKATTAGSSKQRIAKVSRILNPKPSKHPLKSTGQKIPSRPFPKRAKPHGK